MLTHQTTLHEIFQNLWSGRLRIPKGTAARWTPRDVERLLETVARRLPMGSVTIAELAADEEPAAAFGQVRPPGLPPGTPAVYVIDGRQRLMALNFKAPFRLMALVGALGHEAGAGDAAWDYRIDVRNLRAYHRGVLRAEPTPALVPVGHLFRSGRMHETAADITAWAAGEGEDARVRAGADQLATTFHNYPVLAVQLTGGGAAAAAEARERLNEKLRCEAAGDR